MTGWSALLFDYAGGDVKARHQLRSRPTAFRTCMLSWNHTLNHAEFFDVVLVRRARRVGIPDNTGLIEGEAGSRPPQCTERVNADTLNHRSVRARENRGNKLMQASTVASQGRIGGRWGSRAGSSTRPPRVHRLRAATESLAATRWKAMLGLRAVPVWGIVARPPWVAKRADLQDFSRKRSKLTRARRGATREARGVTPVRLGHSNGGSFKWWVIQMAWGTGDAVPAPSPCGASGDLKSLRLGTVVFARLSLRGLAIFRLTYSAPPATWYRRSKTVWVAGGHHF